MGYTDIQHHSTCSCPKKLSLGVLIFADFISQARASPPLFFTITTMVSSLWKAAAEGDCEKVRELLADVAQVDLEIKGQHLLLSCSLAFPGRPPVFSCFAQTAKPFFPH